MTHPNITEYLDSLSNNITKLNLSNSNLSELPDLSRFYNLQVLICNKNFLTIIKDLPETLLVLVCKFNKLTELYLPNSLKKLDCKCNLLTELYLPNNLQELNCSYNKLTKLKELPIKLKKLNCAGNLLTEIYIPKNFPYILIAFSKFCQKGSSLERL